MKRVRVYIDGFNIYHTFDALKRDLAPNFYPGTA